MWRYSLKQKWAGIRSKIKKQPIHPWLVQAWQQSTFPNSQPCAQTSFLVVDLETSSLSVNEGEILSIGWVAIDNSKIQINSSQHLYLKNTQTVGQSAIIHQIRDCQLENGLTLEQALYALLQAACGRVLVFHHSPMDLDFLNYYSKKILGSKLYLPCADTLQIEKRYLDHIGKPIQNGDLTLAKTRTRYHLPNYMAHNALSDAIATAELLLAQLAHKGPKVNLGHILS